MSAPRTPAALLFDVFGTCVHWRSGVAREGAALGRRLGIEGVDWAAVADAWRARYQPQMEPVRRGERDWVDLDTLHREALDDVLAEAGIEGIGPTERDELTRAWHRLDPWPDTLEGMARLRALAILAPVSNGHIALIVALSRRAGLVWDAVLGAELARTYKPRPEVYLRSVAALGLRPQQAMMVAAHADDLEAAAASGLRTAFVTRPDEHGPGGPVERRPDPPAEIEAADLVDLARRLAP